ncbi:hypothetical protein GQX73_g6225 [Xylaria multiplex]|uniref:DUF7708 domain-containing protein n=1 Tax=Xylaria multiplex TaxID=323545 RepID=A0A7C8IME7_9PEZI|nr:hypothetical protein GQX73_g6225 [Xylaria multiplex]
MTSPNPLPDDLEAQRFEGRMLIRRFTDQLTGVDELERSTKAAQAEIDKEEELEETKRLKLLYENPADSSISPQDFDMAEIAREALQGIINKFNEDAKPSMLQRMGISSSKPAKTRAIEVLENSTHGDFNELKASVDNLEKKWKESHGLIYKAFKRICGTLDDHRSILAVFPSQNIYTAVLAASISCLMKAARNHSDIAETLSESIASISDKVATCSNLIIIIKTQRLRRKLANIYARMFEFYKDAIKWYLQSKLSRVFSSFNENMKKGREDAAKDLEDCINELYREASVGSTAMIAILSGKVSNLEAELRHQRENYTLHDTSAGRRMVILMEASWMDSRLPDRTLESTNPTRLAIESASRVRDITFDRITRTQARTYGPALEPFIIGDGGPGLFRAGSFWLAEYEVLPKLRAWMAENTIPRTLWISSPYDIAVTSSARAAALAAVEAAWRAETPLISHFCQRPLPSEMRPGMSIAQVGLIGMETVVQCQFHVSSGDTAVCLRDNRPTHASSLQQLLDFQVTTRDKWIIRTEIQLPQNSLAFSFYASSTATYIERNQRKEPPTSTGWGETTESITNKKPEDHQPEGNDGVAATYDQTAPPAENAFDLSTNLNENREEPLIKATTAITVADNNEQLADVAKRMLTKLQTLDPGRKHTVVPDFDVARLLDPEVPALQRIRRYFLESAWTLVKAALQGKRKLVVTAPRTAVGNVDTDKERKEHDTLVLERLTASIEGSSDHFLESA